MTYWKRLLARDDSEEGARKARWLSLFTPDLWRWHCCLIRVVGLSDLPVYQSGRCSHRHSGAGAGRRACCCSRSGGASRWHPGCSWSCSSFLILPTVFLFGSINAPNILGVFMLIPLSGLLLGRRALMFNFVLCTIVISVIYLAESIGLLALPSRVALRPPEVYVVIMLGIILNTVLLRLTLRDSERSAAEAQSTAETLAMTNRRASGQPLPARAGAQRIGSTCHAAHGRVG